MANKSDPSGQIISLPKGGGAMHGIGEKFAPDLHTGTGNFTVPIALPPGRNGFQPQLSLVYSSGNGNGAFGLGWGLTVPGVARQTSNGVPIYDLLKDTFILAGAEDLVPVRREPGVTFYRPRTEGLFARIAYRHDTNNSFWEVHGKDGLISQYGTPGAASTDPAVVADPTKRSKVFAWRLTQTLDPFGNIILYEYERDLDKDNFHHWDQLYLSRIRYVDYTDDGTTKFLLSVTLEYEERPDAFSEYRAGFEIRTRRRCRAITIRTHAGQDRAVHTYTFTYQTDPPSKLSMLTEVTVSGYDDANNSVTELPPLTFGYTQFEPLHRDFLPLTGRDMPPDSLAHPDYELVDLFGRGLPDVLQMNGVARYWRNIGGTFDLPRLMSDAPAGLALADAGVQLIDANGDGRTDLLVSGVELSGYYPLQFGGLWDRRSFVRYPTAPSFNLEDPEVKLVDLDGDGVTDAIRSGGRLECFFNDRHEGWRDTRWVERQAPEKFPNVQFSDPRVRFADMTGDGLQDVVLVSDRNVEYWPSLGRGSWAKRVSMRNSPHFPLGYDPKRILVGDVDGDGLADIVYVDDTKVTLWINQCGNSWGEPLVIPGTPPVTDADSVRLADMLGTGVGGVLWSSSANELARHRMFFLDFTGGIKPYVLNEMDNHMGGLTRVEYAPSTRFYLEDQKRPETRWKTTLPFPVQVVACVEVIDELSKGKFTTTYCYRHGYWDGAEREFRGFGMVQYETETFTNYNSPGLHEAAVSFASVDPIHFSPPTLSKIWFHQGPIGDEFGEWHEADYSSEYWAGDASLLERPTEVLIFLKGLPRRAKRDALRALRGSILRTELFAVDGTERQNWPYTVTESVYGVCEVIQEDAGQKLSYTPQPGDLPASSDDRQQPLRIFFPHMRAQRTTQWERGDDPMTQLTFTEDYDAYGQARQHTQIACPRGWKGVAHNPGKSYLATHVRTAFAQRDDDQIFIVDRVAKLTTYEIENDGSQTSNVVRLAAKSGTALKLIGQSLNFYDGQAFTGLPSGEIGAHGAVMRTETLVLDEDTLAEAYNDEPPPYLSSDGNPTWTADYPPGFRTLLPVHHVVDVTRPTLTITPVGYGFADGQQDSDYASGYFVATARYRYDFQNDADGSGRGLLKVTRDPLGRDTYVGHDVYDLLPIEVTLAVGLTTKAEYNYRILQPTKVVDANDNWQSFGFTPMGLPAWIAVMDKEGRGDSEATPGTKFVYDFLAYHNSPPGDRQPIFVRSIKRVHHVNEPDVPPDEIDDTIETVEYSDGFGRLLQTRTQAEDLIFGDPVFGGAILPSDQSLPVGDAVGQPVAAEAEPPRVIVSGWQIYDNKGRVVEKYESFFSAGWNYTPPTDEQFGQKITIFYDPRGRMIRTVNPDGSQQTVVHGVPAVLANPNQFAPTPWEVYTYDANDNAGRTHPSTSLAYQQHWNTPGSVEVDALGRTVKAVARNGPNPAIDWSVTRSKYDVRGNLLTVTDAVARIAFRHVYDLAKRPLRTENIDAGVRRIMFDAAGSVVEGRDSKGALALRSYDILNRPARLWARDGTDQPLTMRELLEYGDGGDPQQPQNERDASRLANRLSKLCQHYDEAGLLRCEVYDSKGNVLEKVRQVISDSAILAVFDSPPPNWQIQAFRMDWELQDASMLLDSAEYRTSLTYDALNRMRAMRYPQGVDGARKELRPYYDRAGALKGLELDGATYVERIAYNARGQRSLIAYGNGVMTRHAYDPQTFRLLRLRTERYTVKDLLSYHPTGAPLQDFGYEYDSAGNILRIIERTPGCGVINTPFGADALSRNFTYDPLYRLLSATGRECKDIPAPRPWTDDPRCDFNSGNQGTPNQDNAPNLTALYHENYAYDPANNMVSLKHSTNGASWTRHFGMSGLTPQQWSEQWPNHLGTTGEWMNPPGNRLTHLGDDEPGGPQTHFFDANGNMVRETTSRHFEWDYADRMRVYRTQPEGAEPSVHAHYLYDSSGQRVKKLARKQGGRVEVTVYIDGIFEYQQILQPNSLQESNTLHVMDDQSRIALVRVGTPFPDDTAPAIKFHLGDHLGSNNVVVGDSGDWINREEYTPYGETSLGSFARKRFRFTGKERDEESGLYYHVARYYAPWLGKWVSCDQAGMAAGLNVYAYARGNPIRLVDLGGTDTEPPTPLENAANMSSVELHNTEGPPLPSAEPAEEESEGSKWFQASKSTTLSGAEAAQKATGAGGAPPGSVLSGFQKANGNAAMGKAHDDLQDLMIIERIINKLFPRSMDESLQRAQQQDEDVKSRVQPIEGTEEQIGNLAQIALTSYVEAKQIVANTPTVPDESGTGSRAKLGTVAGPQAGVGHIINPGAATLSGHGVELVDPGTYVIPPGRRLVVLSPQYTTIQDTLGATIDVRAPRPYAYHEIFEAGDVAPNLVLFPPGSLTILGNPTTVTAPKYLSELMNVSSAETVFWAACRQPGVQRPSGRITLYEGKRSVGLF